MSKKATQGINKSSWDEQWSSGDYENPPDLESRTLENEIDRFKLQFLQPVLPSAGRAMEIGCGSARLLARVGQAAPLELHAFDRSEAALRVVARTAAITGHPITRTAGNALFLPFKSESFDLVLSGGLLEHFVDPRPVMAEMVRILRPGGIFYADVVPRRFSMYRIREAWRMFRSPWFMPGVYESTHGARFYEAALEEMGCSDIVIESAGVYPPWKVLRWVTLTHFCDGTWIADTMGWYFMIRARKH